jgi:DAK2 domain
VLINKFALLEALVGFREDLTHFRTQLNEINTLPVPDHDTGDNLLATVSGILAAATVDSVSQTRLVDLSIHETFGNSGMLIGAWLEGAEKSIDVPVSIGQMAFAAADEVQQTIANPQDGLFLDYSRRSAELLLTVDIDTFRNATMMIADDLRMLLIETASKAAHLDQLVDSGSAGLYLLLRRLLLVDPDRTDDSLFEPWVREPSPNVSGNNELVEFLFTAIGPSRDQIVAILSQFNMDSVMLGGGTQSGIRVHCHGSKYVLANLYESLAAISSIDEFDIRQIYQAGPG